MIIKNYERPGRRHEAVARGDGGASAFASRADILGRLTSSQHTERRSTQEYKIRNIIERKMKKELKEGPSYDVVNQTYQRPKRYLAILVHHHWTLRHQLQPQPLTALRGIFSLHSLLRQP